MQEFDTQTLGEVKVGVPWGETGAGQVQPWHALDELTTSELIRDLAGLSA
ncbi:hypothetical protein [Comamonas serinivorans]|nr:hypothetical protein [Comamonas serinivorans]